MSLRDWLYLILLGIAFGSSFFLNEVLLPAMGPLSISAGRVVIGALFCWAFVVATGRLRRVGRKRALAFLVHGSICFAIPFAVLPFAQQYITGGTAGIANALTPVMVVIVSHFWPGGERATLLRSVGILFGFAGIVVMAVPAMGGGAGEFWAIFFALLAPLGYGIGSNTVRWFRDLDTFYASAASLTGASLSILPLALLVEGVPGPLGADAWAALLFMGAVPTGAAFLGLFWLMMRIGATATSTVTFIAPVSAVVLGILFLGEVFTLPQAVGMALIFCGLSLIDGRLWRRLRCGL